MGIIGVEYTNYVGQVPQKKISILDFNRYLEVQQQFHSSDCLAQGWKRWMFKTSNISNTLDS